MKKIAFLVILVLVGLGVFFLRKNETVRTVLPIPSQSSSGGAFLKDESSVSVVAQGLDTPWAIALLPDGAMLVTERKGTVRLVDRGGQLMSEPAATLSSVKEIGEGGLLGIALHPKFSSNGYVYLYYTYSDSEGDTLNRVVRMVFKNNRLTDEKVIVDAIPGASNHNGGRIKFGPDGMLYVTTGDAQNSSRAQEVTSLAGKILRVTDEGKPASGNPFGNLIFSFGHRNPQGLTWDDEGVFFATEHGRSGVLSGLDEVNLIEAGKNYGWPEIQGDEVRAGMETPLKHSGATTTWAPSGAAYLNGSIFFAGLRGQALYEAVLSGNKASGPEGHTARRVLEIRERFKGEFGRLREVVVGPDKMLYVTTSNLDGRGSPKDGDDKIIKINPEKL